jgi:membrane-bound ClpP family serine protease
MNGRSLGGLIIAIIGFLLSLVPLFYDSKDANVALAYGIPILIIGLFVLFNKNEDKIEQRKDKGGSKK